MLCRVGAHNIAGVHMISWDRVNELRDEVGAEDFAEVVDIFLEEVDEVMVRLRTGPHPSNFESELHFLKGSALNLGFQSLAELCSQGEKAASGPPHNQIDPTDVIQVYAKSKLEFNKGQQI